MIPFRLLLGLCALTAALSAQAQERVAAPVRATHPMDALTPYEMASATALLRAAGRLTPTSAIVSLALDENPKAEVRAWTPNKPFPRRALVVTLDTGALAEARVDLTAGAVTSWTPIADRQAGVTFDEFLAVSDVVKADWRWRAAMAKRGVIDLSKIACFPLTVGPAVDPALAKRRLLNVPCVEVSGAENNLWGKPIENVMATVDIATKEVLSVVDLGLLPLPRATPSHAWRDSDRLRRPASPIEIDAPQGDNVAIDGGQVRWDRWSFHVRLDPRLGAVLSLVRYDDRGTQRDVAYQIAASEMFVPYMDPAPTWSFRAYMDIGEYGFGVLASQLRPGEDCPASAKFLDLVIADTKGEPIGMKGVVCVFERPTADPLWRHDEALNGSYESRANVELVVRMAPVVGNYDYLVDYVFNRAGEIEVRLGAYGIDAVKGAAAQSLADPSAAAETAHGTLVAPGLVAVNHDHYIAFRLDMDVDGPDNRLVLDRFTPQRVSNDGPRRSLWRLERQPMAVEGPVLAPAGSAQIRVESANAKNAQGYPTSYQLVPGHADASILAPDDPIQTRAGFAAHTLWASAYAPGERYAAGSYPNQNPNAEGLPQWVAAKRPIDGKDLVLWYTVGFRHAPRAEDWPAMPGLWHSFRLRPYNFFDRSPALDVPPAQAADR